MTSDITKRIMCDYADSDTVNSKASKNPKYTALHMAVRSGKLSLVTQLLQHPRIDVNVTDADNSTPLHHACRRGFTEIVLALVNANFCCRNRKGYPPLHLAAANQHTSVFTALLECEPFCARYCHNPDFLGLKVRTMCRSSSHTTKLTVPFIIINLNVEYFWSHRIELRN